MIIQTQSYNFSFIDKFTELFNEFNDLSEENKYNNYISRGLSSREEVSELVVSLTNNEVRQLLYAEIKSNNELVAFAIYYIIEGDETNIYKLYVAPPLCNTLLSMYIENSEETPINNIETITETTTPTSTILTENDAATAHNSYSIRFSSAPWYNNIQEKTVTLAGLGGIGSYCSLLLSRVRPKRIYLYDNDRVDDTNISGQLYMVNSKEDYKAYVCEQYAKKFSNYYAVSYFTEKFDTTTPATDIMICGFDNMEARKIFFNAWKQRLQNRPDNKEKCLFIDGRLSAEKFQIFCIKGDDDYNIERYKKEFLFSDAEAEETICSYKQTSFCANMIASCMINLFVNFCAIEAGVYRELPFFTSYNAELMFLKTES